MSVAKITVADKLGSKESSRVQESEHLLLKL